MAKVPTTCIECGAKGEVDGPEGMVHKTILCDLCADTAKESKYVICPLCGNETIKWPCWNCGLKGYN